jgi:hypothetical protein
VPHAQEWLDYWMARLDTLLHGEGVEEKIPIEFLDVLDRRYRRHRKPRADIRRGLA